MVNKIFRKRSVIGIIVTIILVAIIFIAGFNKKETSIYNATQEVTEEENDDIEEALYTDVYQEFLNILDKNTGNMKFQKSLLDRAKESNYLKIKTKIFLWFLSSDKMESETLCEICKNVKIIENKEVSPWIIFSIQKADLSLEQEEKLAEYAFEQESKAIVIGLLTRLKLNSRVFIKILEYNMQRKEILKTIRQEESPIAISIMQYIENCDTFSPDDMERLVRLKVPYITNTVINKK